jgi:hypothetical protein
MSSSKLGDGCCRTHRQHPQGPRHQRRLKPQWWTLSDPPTAPHRGPPLTSSSKLGGRRCQTRRQRPQGGRHRCLAATGSYCQYPLPTPRKGALVDYHYWACYKQDNSQKNWILAMLRTRRRETVKKISSNVTKSKVYLQRKKCRGHRYKRGALCIFRLALEPLSYDLHSFSDADLCSLRNLLSMSLHHWL